MIVSASRRTDIPAFHARWMLRRLEAGFALTENPRNPQKLTRVPLQKGLTDIIWFWSKSPAPLLKELPRLDSFGIPYGFHFTLTPNGPLTEPGTADKERLLRDFLALSEQIGPQRVIWRYDPILLAEELSVGEHIRLFGRMARILRGSTQRCILSFLDLYARNRASLTGVCRPPEQAECLELAKGLSEAASQNGIALFTCAEEMDLSAFGIGHAACIDKALSEQIAGHPIRTKKASGQRPLCGCAESADIGAYDTCPMGCRYCYATAGQKAVQKRFALCDPDSPLLCGQVNGREIVEKAAR